MGADINPGYINRTNIISIGISHNVNLYTDRPLVPGDGKRGDLLNRTNIGHQIWDSAEVYTAPGSGSFNPE